MGRAASHKYARSRPKFLQSPMSLKLHPTQKSMIETAGTGYTPARTSTTLDSRRRCESAPTLADIDNQVKRAVTARNRARRESERARRAVADAKATLERIEKHLAQQIGLHPTTPAPSGSRR